MQDVGVSILITRRVRPEARAAYEQAVRNWIPRAVQFPGHLGVFMVRPGAGSNEFGALVRFHSLDAWREFEQWPPYLDFLAEIQPMLIAEPTAKPLHGLEAWFTPTVNAAPPRWKMALLTWVGVNLIVIPARTVVGSFFASWPTTAIYLLTNAVVVVALTWLIMPLLTRAAQSWLVHADAPEKNEGSVHASNTQYGPVERQDSYVGFNEAGG